MRTNYWITKQLIPYFQKNFLDVKIVKRGSVFFDVGEDVLSFGVIRGIADVFKNHAFCIKFSAGLDHTGGFHVHQTGESWNRLAFFRPDDGFILSGEGGERKSIQRVRQGHLRLPGYKIDAVEFKNFWNMEDIPQRRRLVRSSGRAQIDNEGWVKCHAAIGRSHGCVDFSDAADHQHQ